MIHNQLLPGIQLNDEATFDNFFVGDNTLLIEQLKTACLETNDQALYVWGSQGNGCTHLLQACCHFAANQGRTALYLPLAQFIDGLQEMLNGLESIDIVCLDDIDSLADHQTAQEALFHFYNKTLETKTSLIVAAKQKPKHLGFTLPDLVSRLNWGLLLPVKELTDTQKIQALSFRARARGFDLPRVVGEFLLKRCARDWPSLIELLTRLDQASLSAKKPLTVPFVKQALNL